MRRLSVLPLLAVVLLAVSVLPSCGGEADKALAPFDAEGFSVSMPGKPQRSTETANTPAGPITVILYSSEGRNKAYVASYIDLPPGVEGDLAGAISGAAGAVQGTATDEVPTTYQSFPARDARITNADDGDGNKGTAFLRVINANNRLYQLQYIQAGGDVKTPDSKYPEFLSSLKIG